MCMYTSVDKIRKSYFNYYCQGGGYVIWSVCVYVCHSFCMQDYCRSNQLISLKIAVMIGLTNRRN